jgi:hypothetical protein
MGIAGRHQQRLVPHQLRARRVLKLVVRANARRDKAPALLEVREEVETLKAVCGWRTTRLGCHAPGTLLRRGPGVEVGEVCPAGVGRAGVQWSSLRGGAGTRSRAHGVAASGP